MAHSTLRALLMVGIAVIAWILSDTAPVMSMGAPGSSMRKRILLVGETGAGKSTLANDLLGKSENDAVFKTSDEFQSCTATVQSECGNLFGEDLGSEVDIVDTPGFGDSEGRDGNIRKMVKDELTKGVHGIFYVHNAQQTRVSQQTQTTLMFLFGQVAGSKEEKAKLLERVAFVFTFGDSRRSLYEVAFPKELKRNYGISPSPPQLWPPLKDQNYVARMASSIVDRVFGEFRSKTENIVQELPEEPIKISVPSSSAPSQSSGSFCIDGDAMVTVRCRGNIPLRELQNDDEVSTRDGWARVVAWMHKDSATGTVQALELTALTASKPKEVMTLKLTPDHLVMVSGDVGGHPNARPARDVAPGEYLVVEGGRLALVTSIKSVTMRGAFAPLTASGDLFVNGIWTSCYVDVGAPFWAVHLFMAPFRKPWWPSRLRPQRDVTWLWLGAAWQRARSLVAVLGSQDSHQADTSGQRKLETGSPLSTYMWSERVPSSSASS